ncbi:MAG: ABC transporter substrate-binding protein [Ferruginibacter sp.]
MVTILILTLAFFSGKTQVKIAADTLLTPVTKTYRVGIFAPLYIDSVFTGYAYKYGVNFPKFLAPGLDFIQGSQIALDSLTLPNTQVKVSIFDSKSFSQSVPQLINNKSLDSLDLIIGAVKDQEYIQLANFAKEKHVPFISATHPNDGGITSNPFMVIVNATLRAHCEGIFSYILQNHGTDKIYLVRKPGEQENTVEDLFKKINSPDSKALLNIEVINVNEDFSVIKNKLDSNRNSVIIGGSLNETFANNLATYAQSVSNTYSIKLIGMPNWDGFVSLTKNKKLKDFPVYYTTPYYNNKADEFSKKIKEVYLFKYKGVPSDMTYKGYEITMQFVRLLQMYPNNLLSHLNDYNQKIFSEYHFKPVHQKKDSPLPDYFENKNLYFIKMLNGNVSKAW